MRMVCEPRAVRHAASGHQDRLPETEFMGGKNQGVGLGTLRPDYAPWNGPQNAITFPFLGALLFAAGAPRPRWRRALPDGAGRW